MNPAFSKACRHLSVVAVITSVLSGCVINIGSHSSTDHNGNVDKVFGSIDIGENRQVASLTTVNGSISLRSNVTADALTTVNGDVTLGDYCEINSITVVNGDIHTGQGLIVKQNIETVNGQITLGPNALLHGELANVNGDISASDLTLNGDLHTVNANIRLTGNTQITGNIVYNASENNSSKHIPRLYLDEKTQLSGSIVLHREVELQIPDHLHSKVQYQTSAM